jgi:NAD(P)-dependent dehydrogenase (short-subunit alcohol dehydrogenase family)
VDRAQVENLALFDWSRIMLVNIVGTMLALKHGSPHLLAGASIVLTGSVSAPIGTNGYVAYQRSKAAVLGLMRAANVEFAPQGIRVNAVSPGWVDTGFTARSLAALPDGAAIRANAAAAHLMGQIARSEETGQAILFLLSQDARFITETELVLNGGFLRKK